MTAIFSINYDVSGLMMIQSTIGDLLSTQDQEQTEPERIINVNHVLMSSLSSPWPWWESLWP